LVTSIGAIKGSRGWGKVRRGEQKVYDTDCTPGRKGECTLLSKEGGIIRK